jgi:hypothetical protein
MSALRRRPEEQGPPPERPAVREYRYLLCTAPVADLEELHRRAIARLDPLTRGNVLRTTQERLLSGQKLTVDDTVQLAQLFVVAEVRMPGVIVSALHVTALERLATLVLRDPAAEPLREGYGAWDGVAPEQSVSMQRLESPAVARGA